MVLIDGLGGEEVNQTTNVQTAYVYATADISGLNVYGKSSGTFARINNGDGLINSVYLASGATTRNANAYGGKIQVGQVTTSAGSAGTVLFPVPFSVGSYFIAFTPLAATAMPAKVVVTSGALRASGCEVIGEASKDYGYIAVGI